MLERKKGNKKGEKTASVIGTVALYPMVV